MAASGEATRSSRCYESLHWALFSAAGEGSSESISRENGPILFCCSATSLPDCSTVRRFLFGAPSCQCRPVSAQSPGLPVLCPLLFVVTDFDVGNTVYIGLGLAAPRESTRWIKSATSLGCFCVGSFCFSRFHRYFSPKRRWVLCASFAFQMTLIIGAAIIVTLGPTAGKEDISWNVLVPIALVAFQACGQAVASRALKHNALTSVVLTSIYCDLFSDANLFTVHNVERNQRTGAPLLLLFGACMGGLLAHSEVGIAGALWIAAVLKFFIVLSWFYWPADPSSEED